MTTQSTPETSMTQWQPKWYGEEHVTAWTRAKEALRRDWEQTKRDLGVGGHELNQGAEDTIRQAARTEAIPRNDGPNPPGVIGAWKEAEYPIGYGYAARRAFGAEHPMWNEGIEQRLRSEWNSADHPQHYGWSNVEGLVRYGYTYSQ